MKNIFPVNRTFSKKSKRTATLVVAAALFVAVISGFGGVHQAQVSAATVQDCTANSIIKCGAQTPADFVAKAKANNPADLQAIYNDFRLPATNYDAFATNAKQGVAYKDGTLKVDGKTVATNAWSIGRQKFSYSTDYNIAGKTYYKSYNKDVFNADSLDALVYFGPDGNVLFAVLKACGNPIGGSIVKQTPPVTPPTPPAPTPTPPAPTPKPVVAFKCTGLTGTPSDTNKMQYIFTATTTNTNATLKGADFNFGDGTSSMNVAPSTTAPTTVAVTHDFARAGKFTTTATVHYVPSDSTQSQTVKDTTCQVTITVNQVTPTAVVTPTAPAPTAPVPTAPQPVTLPATGPAGIIGLFGGASALGTLGYRMRLRRKANKADQLVDSLLQQ